MLVNTDMCKYVLKFAKLFLLNEKLVSLSYRPMYNDREKSTTMFKSRK